MKIYTIMGKSGPVPYKTQTPSETDQLYTRPPLPIFPTISYKPLQKKNEFNTRKDLILKMFPMFNGCSRQNLV